MGSMDQPDGSARGGRREESAVSSGCQILNEVFPSACPYFCVLNWPYVFEGQQVSRYG